MIGSGYSEGIALIVLAATLLGFAAKRTGQPTVVAYILAGMILGPVGFSLVGETEFTSLLSELGLVFLLFLIGLEIKLDEVREILKPTVIISVSQMILTFCLGLSTGFLLGFGSAESVFFGIAAMFSSTALVVKLLTDKDETGTLPERIDIGILLVQDVAVILILALISAEASGLAGLAFRSAEIFVVILLIAGISFLSSRYFLPRLFREISENQHAFFIHGVAWAFLFITMAQQFNLSMEIGAFFAGLSLAQLPYSRELQERVRPLTDIFMAVFFINFGLEISPGQLSEYLLEAVIASTVVIFGKFAIIFGAVDQQNFTPETSFKSAINMTQISEFSLILGALAVSEGIIADGFLGFLSMVAIITMGTSSYLINYNETIYSRFYPLIKRFESDDKSDVEVDSLEDHAVVIGYDSITENLLPVLEEYYDQIVVVDRNPENVEELASSDYRYIYGDIRHGEIQNSSGLYSSDIVISVAPSHQVNKEILQRADRETKKFLKSDSEEEAGELYELGAQYVIIKNILTGEKMAEYVKLYLEDRELFRDETASDIDRIMYGGDS